MRQLLKRLLLIAALAIFVPVTGQAQFATLAGETSAEATLPDPLTPEAVREMVAKMPDAAVRSLLLERLDAVARAAEEEKTLSLLTWVESAVSSVTGGIGHALSVTPQMPHAIADAFARFYNPRGAVGMVMFLAWFTGIVIVGVVASRLIRRLVRPLQTQSVLTGSLRETIANLLRRLLIRAAGAIAFFAVSWLLIQNVMPPDAYHPIVKNSDRTLAWLILSVLVLYVWVAWEVSEFLLSPDDPSLRLLTVTDAQAAFLRRHVTIIGGLWGFTAVAVIFFLSHGVPIGEMRIGFWFNVLLYAWMFWTTWAGRDALVKMMLGAEPETATPTETFVARWYPTFAMTIIVMNWLLIEYLISQRWFDLLDGRQNLTLALLLYAPTFDTAVRGLVRHLAPPMRGEGVIAEAAYLSTKRSYIRIGRVIVFGLVVMVVARLWGIDFENIAAAGVGAKFAAGLVEVLIILAVGYLSWELISLWINRKLAAEQTALGFDLNEDEPGGGEGGGAGGSRLSTVLPLLLGFLKFAIATIVALIALGNVGLDITPLLAGAGIVGIAVGFGAQKLVADVVSGVFFLIDDAFRTGEYVEVEGTVGTVEKISVRSMQLRHHKGPVHTIPYGEIPKVTNYSRDWVIMKLKFTVPFETDPNKVKKIFKKIGAEMMEVPEYAADLLQPFKSQGVFDFDDVGMIIRGKFMAKPGKQFTLRKEVYNRVQAAFAANGIDFARREVRVAIPGLNNAEKMTEEDKAAIAAAASQAAQQQLEEGGEKPK